jgi:hypothetical protein
VLPIERIALKIDDMPDETLMLLARDVRNKTLKLLDGLTDAQARFAAPGLNNSILWNAGHALVVVEHLGVGPATGQPPVLPDGWFDKFSWKSQPATVKEWPAVGDVIGKLKDQLQRLTAAIEALSPQQLSQLVGDPARGRNLRWNIMHGLHDEANHQGEMYLLRKIQAKV